MKNGLTEAQIEGLKAMGVKFYNSPEEAELDYLREGLRRTPEERFVFLMKLMKIQRLMKGAKFIEKNERMTNSGNFLRLWRTFNTHRVQYLLTGDYAAALYGYNYFTGGISIWIENDFENRRQLQEALQTYGNAHFDGLAEIDLSRGFVSLFLDEVFRLDIYGNHAGAKANFNECFREANVVEIEDERIPVLRLVHLIANKKAVGRPKDQLDVIYLEKIQKLRDEEK